MKILLDTHILIWALTDSPKLTEKARNIILNDENDIYYSIVSLWEIEIKHLSRPENLPFSSRLVSECCKESGYQLLQLNENSIFTLSELTRPDTASVHKDPFDRILICQAVSDDMSLLTHDAKIAEYNTSNIVLV